MRDTDSTSRHLHQNLPVRLNIRGVEIHVYTLFLFVGITRGIISGVAVGRAAGDFRSIGSHIRCNSCELLVDGART